MTVELQEQVGGPEIPVLASHVQLEVENSAGRSSRFNAQRKGESDLRLVTVFRGARLTEPDARYERRDYYALDPGAAQASTGLHTFLADFLGWDLPRVSRYSGGDSPLYLEALFSLAFVEQKVGWSAIPQTSQPTWGLRTCLVGRSSTSLALAPTILKLTGNESWTGQQLVGSAGNA